MTERRGGALRNPSISFLKPIGDSSGCTSKFLGHLALALFLMSTGCGGVVAVTKGAVAGQCGWALALKRDTATKSVDVQNGVWDLRHR
jgi:hypothetical protein